MSQKPLMIYGATGYTGELIAARAVAMGLKPILAGRDKARVTALAQRLGLEARIAPLDDAKALDAALAGVGTVLHCAGPFSRTSRPMLAACLKARANYLDITGEIDVFEQIYAHDEDIAAAGIVAMPGVGFDVVPTDCLAVKLKSLLPDASELTLAFHSTGGISPGTAKTALEKLGKGFRRRSGTIVSMPRIVERDIVFVDKARRAMSIPWGDIASAFRSTAIPNIDVFVSTPPRQIQVMRMASRLSRVVSAPPVKRFLTRMIEQKVKGPSESVRANARVQLWGEAKNASGKTVTARLETPEGYALTIETALAAAQRVQNGTLKPGAYTPAEAFGAEFISQFPGVTWRL
jgi:short subunit dehydrogenase-like uncharacterized protein